ncbi:DUF424 domain-containing protein [Conexivisphaera calida]|uniref:DUF424 domain-containing protein n=1 Tax=Conexivisphaera calida TaxID=1874277 RepID=A0A4P2VAU6_9ARCH|nr:DUF424 family protein [Conexivisphaera calida]BBE41614.1 hypothetical protein NAS2_0217 [Conexivisphaera calida]
MVRKVPYKNMLMVNVCDEELLGRHLSEGELSVDITPEYFSGESMKLESAIALIEEAAIVNLVGSSIVGEVLRRGLAHPGAVRTIDGVPFLMIFKFTSDNYGP